MSNLVYEDTENWKTVTNPKREQHQKRPPYYSFFRPGELFRCVTGIPGKNQIIAVLNTRSDPLPRRELRTTLDMNAEELKVLFRGFLQASRKRADEVRLSEHHGILRSKKEFHVHFIFSGMDFAEVYPHGQDRFKLQEMETARRVKLMEWAAKDLEKSISELSKINLEPELIAGLKSDIVERVYHPKYAKIIFTTSCDFFGFSRTFAFVKEYIQYYDLKNFHLIVSHDSIEVAMTCDEYVSHLLPIMGLGWVRGWILNYESAFQKEERGTILDS